MTRATLYKSKYGATPKYADWLSERTGFPCVETSKADINEISTYDVIVLGGGIYASGIAGLSFFKKHIKNCKIKRFSYSSMVHLPMRKLHSNRCVSTI